MFLNSLFKKYVFPYSWIVESGRPLYAWVREGRWSETHGVGGCKGRVVEIRSWGTSGRDAGHRCRGEDTKLRHAGAAEAGSCCASIAEPGGCTIYAYETTARQWEQVGRLQRALWGHCVNRDNKWCRCTKYLSLEFHWCILKIVTTPRRWMGPLLLPGRRCYI